MQKELQKKIIEGKSCIFLDYEEHKQNSYVNIQNRLYRILKVDNLCIENIIFDYKLIGFKTSKQCQKFFDKYDLDNMYFHYIAFMGQLGR